MAREKATEKAFILDGEPTLRFGVLRSVGSSGGGAFWLCVGLRF